MMKVMGWDGGALGDNSDGITQPIMPNTQQVTIKNQQHVLSKKKSTSGLSLEEGNRKLIKRKRVRTKRKLMRRMNALSVNVHPSVVSKALNVPKVSGHNIREEKKDSHSFATPKTDTLRNVPKSSGVLGLRTRDACESCLETANKVPRLASSAPKKDIQRNDAQFSARMTVVKQVSTSLTTTQISVEQKTKSNSVVEKRDVLLSKKLNKIDVSVTVPDSREMKTDSHLIASIINGRSFTGKFSQTDIALVKNVLESELDKFILTGHPAPTFDNWRTNQGVLKIICSNEASLHWLEKTIADLPPLEYNCELKLVQIDMMPKVVKASLWLLNESEDPPAVMQRLQNQNPTLSIEKWGIFNHVRNTKGLLIVVGIPQEVIPVLKDNQNKISYMFSSLEVNVL